MEWINKIGRIVCLNLASREDRLLDFTNQMEEYQIPFERIEAIYDKQGAKGLRDTMIKLFNEEIEKGTEHLLVFEDDAEVVVNPETFHDSMNKVMEQLPENYHMVFLGCQLTSNQNKWQSANLIQVIKAFSTHAVVYSLQGMKEIVSRGMDFPIDNWMSETIQNERRCYCTYPFLCSQRPGISDINAGHFVDWKPFLDQKYNQQIHNVKR